jgi:predicted TIM-barrel fold metal-dependent hydrolase
MKKTALILALLSSSAFAQPTPDSIAFAKVVPIADIHMHTNRLNPRSASWWKETMDANGVKWGGAVGDYREDVQAELGERYIPTLGQPEFFTVFFRFRGASQLADPDNFKDLYAQADQLFTAGKIKGLGEFHTDNHTSGHPRIRRHIRTDNPAMRKFYEIANKHSGFVQIHAQFDRDFEKDILSLSADFPNTTTVLSHCLSTSNADDLATLFKQRKNIVCELSAGGTELHRLLGLNNPARVYDSGGPFNNWKTLIETYPNQVMLGTDPCCGADGGYSELISEMRTNLLPYFKTEIIEKVAYKNAVRLFKLDGVK